MQRGDRHEYRAWPPATQEQCQFRKTYKNLEHHVPYSLFLWTSFCLPATSYLATPRLISLRLLHRITQCPLHSKKHLMPLHSRRYGVNSNHGFCPTKLKLAWLLSIPVYICFIHTTSQKASVCDGVPSPLTNCQTPQFDQTHVSRPISPR